jgi:hypothetical protein
MFAPRRCQCVDVRRAASRTLMIGALLGFVSFCAPANAEGPQALSGVVEQNTITTTGAEHTRSLKGPSRPSLRSASLNDRTLAVAFALQSGEDEFSTQTREWQRFRQAFPFNMQTIAVSNPSESGERTLIVSEPPPHWISPRRETPNSLKATSEPHSAPAAHLNGGIGPPSISAMNCSIPSTAVC